MTPGGSAVRPARRRVARAFPGRAAAQL